MADGKIVSNVSVNTCDMNYDGRIVKLIQLGTVMTDPDYRGRGYARMLMEKIIEDYEPVFGPLERKKDIKFQKETVSQMLSRPEYYRFYFTQGQSTLQWFSQMHKDYCSGKYMTFPYDRAGRLIDILPEKLSRNKVLVEGILKLIDAGWLGELYPSCAIMLE